MSAFTEPLAQVRAALPKPQGLYGPMCECEECCDKASALAALAQVERLATEQEELLARILDHADAGYQEHQARRSAYLSAREEGAALIPDPDDEAIAEAGLRFAAERWREEGADTQ